MSLKDLRDTTCDTEAEALEGVLRLGAALDGVEAEARHPDLPRILRYACLPDIREAAARVSADVAIAAPTLADVAAAWAIGDEHRGWAPLAASLDEAAVHLDSASLRGSADIVRLISMSVGDLRTHRPDALRVLAALEAADDRAVDWLKDARPHLAEIDVVRIGWGQLVLDQLRTPPERDMRLFAAAFRRGEEATRNIVAQVEAQVLEHCQPVDGSAATDPFEVAEPQRKPRSDRAVAGDRMLVCPSVSRTTGREREVTAALDGVIGRALPLTRVPDLADVRRQLVSEYPYAVEEVGRVLSPLVGRSHVTIPPTILVGPPGSGKSRLARRLAECLGVTCWRTDGARADGNTFGGTDRRWSTHEPCHPFLAVARARNANPLVLVDEVDKAATRSDHGRLWDALLPFLERETAAAYPDPCLQTDLDLSAVSYVMTANGTDGLPAPLLDRCRIVVVPEPGARDMPALLRSLLGQHAADAGLDPAWFEPLDAQETATLGRHWRGGSVRRLRVLLDVLLRGRERLRPVH